MTASTQAEQPAIARALDARVQNELGERWVHVTLSNGHQFNVPILRLIGPGAYADAAGHAHWGNTDFDHAYEARLRAPARRRRRRLLGPRRRRLRRLGP